MDLSLEKDHLILKRFWARPTQAKKFQFGTVSRQISPKFILCHFCPLQFKLKALFVLQDTMNIPYHISDSK